MFIKKIQLTFLNKTLISFHVILYLDFKIISLSPRFLFFLGYLQDEGYPYMSITFHPLT